eukprot:jgi/Tetstr1/429205/TSEL_019157.t1
MYVLRAIRSGTSTAWRMWRPAWRPSARSASEPRPTGAPRRKSIRNARALAARASTGIRNIATGAAASGGDWPVVFSPEDREQHKPTPRKRSRSRGSRIPLTPSRAKAFPSDSLHDQLGRVVCGADCLPTKEFFESWEFASLVRNRFRNELQSGEVTIVDLAAGHGLTAWMLLVMEPACRSALCVDITRPDSSRSLEVAMTKAWPRLAGRVRYVTGRLEDVRPHPDCLLIAIHACGPLTDFVIRLAETSGATLAVMPCCHSAQTCDTGGLEKWLPLGAAVDATRATHLAKDKALLSAVLDDCFLRDTQTGTPYPMKKTP